jgi:hypothetical protein
LWNRQRKIRSIVENFREQGGTFWFSAEADRTTPWSIFPRVIRQWDRLRLWVDEEAESAKIYRRLAESARINRIPAGTADVDQQRWAGFYRNPDLQIALSWQQKQKPSSAWAKRYGYDFGLAIEFLQASERQRQEDEATALLARQRELWRRRRQSVALTGVSVALSLTIWAYWERGRANREARLAKDQTVEAQRAAGVAEEEKQRADSQANLATQRRKRLNRQTIAEREKQRADDQANLATQRAQQAASSDGCRAGEATGG